MKKSLNSEKYGTFAKTLVKKFFVQKFSQKSLTFLMSWYKPQKNISVKMKFFTKFL